MRRNLGISFQNSSFTLLFSNRIKQVNMQLDKNRPFFENLNGLRFTGALLVFVFHCFTLNREIWGDFFQHPVFQSVYKLASKGHHGVGLFFVLSGFLITYLLLQEAKQNGKINIRNFFMRRILRIWPLYFLIVIFGFFIFPNLPFGKETLHSLAYYATFLSNIDELRIGLLDNLNFLTITWSVSIEEQFYLSWMLLMLVLPFFRKGKYFPVLFISWITVSIVFRFIHFDDARTIYFHTFSVISDLAIGGLLAYYVQKYQVQRYISEIKKGVIISIYFLGFGLIIFSKQLFFGHTVAIERLIVAAFFAFIILEQVFAKNSIFKIDKVPYFYSSGELTYGFYMFHCIFIYYWSIFFENNGFTEHLWQFFLYMLIVFISTYFTALLSAKYFEKPLLKLKKYFR